MQIILLKKVPHLGNIGEIVKVKDGFARNFLIPFGHAIVATDANKKRFDDMKANIERDNAGKRSDAEKLAKSVEGAVVTLIRQAGEDGKLFGSVNSRDIAMALVENKFNISRTQVNIISPIKYIGIHSVSAELHPDVVVSVKVNIARSEDEAKEALSALAASPAVEAEQE
jgi:large subunit ribosomal protein L9